MLCACPGTTKNEGFHSYLKSCLLRRGHSHRLKFRHMENLVRLYIHKYNKRSSRPSERNDGRHLDYIAGPTPRTTILRAPNWTAIEAKRFEMFQEEHANIKNDCHNRDWTPEMRQELIAVLLTHHADDIHNRDAIHWLKQNSDRNFPRNKQQINMMLKVIQRGIRMNDKTIMSDIDSVRKRKNAMDLEQAKATLNAINVEFQNLPDESDAVSADSAAMTRQ